MDTKKFEKLMDLVINEDNERAQELFHEIVVEKSREIFESIMAEEMEDDLDEGMGGRVARGCLGSIHGNPVQVAAHH